MDGALIMGAGAYNMLMFLKTGEDNETALALRRSSLWISYGEV
jgi:hypothetical protein